MQGFRHFSSEVPETAGHFEPRGLLARTRDFLHGNYASFRATFAQEPADLQGNLRKAQSELAGSIYVDVRRYAPSRESLVISSR